MDRALSAGGGGAPALLQLPLHLGLRDRGQQDRLRPGNPAGIGKTGRGLRNLQLRREFGGPPKQHPPGDAGAQLHRRQRPGMPGLCPGAGAGLRPGDRQPPGPRQHRGRQGRPGHRHPALGRREAGPAWDHGPGGSAPHLRRGAKRLRRRALPAGHGEGLRPDLVHPPVPGAPDQAGQDLYRGREGPPGGPDRKKTDKFLF